MSGPEGKAWPLFMVKGSVYVRVEVPAEMVVKARSRPEAEDRSHSISKQHPERVVIDVDTVLAAIIDAPFDAALSWEV